MDPIKFKTFLCEKPKRMKRHTEDCNKEFESHVSNKRLASVTYKEH